ncbi:hypothetical protein [Polaromonas sp. AET17H-212]|uniref:hypothetical protein n=1 Tax=Polaromonas sp. AET17H-212 TaxID=1977061 RepID=UPI001144BA40|nr:hypothetical protein [Polaromonas sp. AET17H-212]
MGPLHGIKIIDMTSVLMGPFATLSRRSDPAAPLRGAEHHLLYHSFDAPALGLMTPCGHGQSTLRVVLTRLGRMLHTGARRQLQAVTQAAQIHRQRAVAVDSYMVNSYWWLSSQVTDSDQ